jgi:hypothetical protein
VINPENPCGKLQAQAERLAAGSSGGGGDDYDDGSGGRCVACACVCVCVCVFVCVWGGGGPPPSSCVPEKQSSTFEASAPEGASSQAAPSSLQQCDAQGRCPRCAVHKR